MFGGLYYGQGYYGQAVTGLVQEEPPSVGAAVVHLVGAPDEAVNLTGVFVDTVYFTGCQSDAVAHTGSVES